MLFNFANVNIMPSLKRIQGMGLPRNLGNRAFAMRVWLKLDRMRAYKLSTQEVMEALAEQSVIGSPGRLGQATGKTSQSLEYVLTYVGRYNTPEQYENIILKANPEGEILRLDDADLDVTIPGMPSPAAAFALREEEPFPLVQVRRLPGVPRPVRPQRDPRVDPHSMFNRMLEFVLKSRR